MVFQRIKFKKSFYFKLLTTYISIILILIIALSLLLYNVFVNNSMNTIKDYNMKILSQISYSSVYIDGIAKNMSKSIYMNSSVNAFINNSSTYDPINVSSIYLYLDTITIPNTYIDSVYIYNGKTSTYLSSFTGEVSNSAAFYDKNIVSLLNEAGNAKIPFLKPIPRLIPSINSNNEDVNDTHKVYTYAIYNEAEEDNSIESAIIINIDADWLRNMVLSLDQFSASESTNIMIIDNQGIVISDYQDQMFLTSIKNEKYISEILQNSRSTGTFSQSMGNKKQIITFSYSEDLGWYFIATIPYKKAFSSIIAVKTAAVVFCLLVLLVGILAAYIASKKFYMPVKNLMQKIRSSFSTNSGKNMHNEFEYLSEAFSEVMNDTEKLKELTRDNRHTVRNEFLRRIILSQADLEEVKLAEMGIRLDFRKNLLLLVLRIDKYHHFIHDNNEKGVSALKFAIANIAEELLDKFLPNVVVDMGDDNFAVLLSLEDSSMGFEKMHTDLVPHIRQIQEACKNCLNISISAAISNPTNSGQLFEEWNNTCKISMYRYIYGHSCILLPDVMGKINTNCFTVPPSKEKNLLNALRMGSFDEAKVAYHEIISLVSDHSPSSIYTTVIYIAYSVYNSLNMAIEKNNLNVSRAFDSFFNNLGIYETLSEVNKAFEVLFDKVIAELDRVNSRKTSPIIENAFRIINEKYGDRNLCLNKIAEMLDRSPAYVGKLFKEVTAKSVSEYIMDVRMEKVKHYLDNSNMGINDILEKTGMEKSNYFYTAFKKYFGISLSAYRQGAVDKEIEKL